VGAGSRAQGGGASWNFEAIIRPPMEEQPKTEPPHQDIRHEVINVRQTTTTREAIRLTISQRYADNNELALATASLSGKIPTYVESPDFLEDLGMALIIGAHFMRRWNRHVNGNKR